MNAAIFRAFDRLQMEMLIEHDSHRLAGGEFWAIYLFTDTEERAIADWVEENCES